MPPIPSRTFIALFLVVSISLSSLHAEETYPLRKLLLSDTEQKAAAMDPASSGPGRIVTKDLPLFATEEFDAAVGKFFGQPISTAVLNGLIAAISSYAHAHDRSVATVEVPDQNVTTGALRLGVIIRHYNQLDFRGNRWFSTKLLEKKLGIKPGDEVKLSALVEAVAWANSNPFRHVEVLVNNLPAATGKSDLIVGVQEQRPYRLAASYDDSGSSILGRNHYTASVQLGNLWGRDHLASYQFVTTDALHLYQAHSIDYRMPLGWRHFLQFSASYVEVKPSLVGGLLLQTGKTILSNLRYTIPLHESSDNPSELYGGIDFKQTNNSLEFAYQDQYFNAFSSTIDTFQATIGASHVRHDKHGAWLLAGALVASPGGVDSRNTTRTFQSGRKGASARYVYGTLAVQRLQNFDSGWSLFSRLNGQYSSSILIPNERFSIGGVNTIRGFNPNVFDGDGGYVVSTELQTPASRQPLAFRLKRNPTLETRLLAFYDFGQVFYHSRQPRVNGVGQQIGWDTDFLRPLASTGIGLRMNAGTNFSMSLDYGWAVTHPKAPVDDHGRGDIKVVLAY